MLLPPKKLSSVSFYAKVWLDCTNRLTFQINTDVRDFSLRGHCQKLVPWIGNQKFFPPRKPSMVSFSLYSISRFTVQNYPIDAGGSQTFLSARAIMSNVPAPKKQWSVYSKNTAGVLFLKEQYHYIHVGNINLFSFHFYINAFRLSEHKPIGLQQLSEPIIRG